MSAIRSVSRRSFERTIASAKRTMVLSEIVSLAIDSFRANKVRVMLTSLGMVIGGHPTTLPERPIDLVLGGYGVPTMLEGMGHWPQLEAPDATNAALVAFLQYLERTPS